MFDPVSYAMGKQAGGGGGGGNPNYTETITGTVANPFGDYSFGQIIAMVIDNSASVIITASAFGLTIDAYATPGEYYGNDCIGGYFISFVQDQHDDWELDMGLQAIYTAAGLQRAVMCVSGTISDAIDLASDIDTVTTIIHHPLPDTP